MELLLAIAELSEQDCKATMTHNPDLIQPAISKDHPATNPKKKTRRHDRKKNKKKDEKPDSDATGGEDQVDDVRILLEMTLNLTIQAVTSQKCGILIRQRNVKCHYINSDYTTSKNIPFVYRSRPCEIFSQATTTSHERVNPADDKTSVQNGSVRKNRKFIERNHDVNLQSAAAQAKSKRKHRKRNSTNGASGSRTKYEEFWNSEDIENGLLTGELIKGIIRINLKNTKHAYVNNDDRNSEDYLINSIVDRNRALEGDVVVLKPKPESEWPENRITAKVVCISQMVHSREAIGFLSVLYDRGVKIVSLQPRDSRLPRIKISKLSLPPMYFKNPKEYDGVLFMAKITQWTEPKFASGAIVETLGISDEVKTETKAILFEHQLDVEPFPPSVYRHIPSTKEIPKEEFDYREDLRRECVFTIDPLTARDLDDAVSCRVLSNGNFEIGVHIADVAHFLQPGTDLDDIVCKKGTTVYLVNNVYHMLPVELCQHCSLLPNADCLAFSVFWEMTPDGEILSHRFAKTVINSCCQLAYEHVQKMIDGDAMYRDDLPEIHNEFSAEDLHDIVTKLRTIAANLRRKRYENGALRLDQLKVMFKLNAQEEPIDIFTYENKESHQLIEEFMLLANITVAKKIKDDFPEVAFLRCHERPNPRMLIDVQQTLEIIGIHIDIESAADLHDSLQRYSTDDYLGKARNMVLNHLLTKPMVRARYYCASHPSVDSFEHYALSIPIYTHFTSPIRRYADIMVHRLLAASLGYCDKPSWDVDFVQQIAENCNKQKYNAKKAGDASSNMFLVHYIENNEPFIQDAVVVNVNEKTFEILVLSTGSVVRMFVNDLGDGVTYRAEKFGKDEKKIWKLCVLHPPENDKPETMQVIEIFQIIRVQLSRKGKKLDLQAQIIRPDSS